MSNEKIENAQTGKKRGFLVFVVIGIVISVVAVGVLLASGVLNGNNAESQVDEDDVAITSNEDRGVTSNEDWTPQEQDFDGVTMVLVPAGCFMMGNEDTTVRDQKPAHEQCFDTPFWIDKYEVSQAQFEQFGGQKANPNRFIGDDLPVENITWFEARDYCVLRGGRLPTEREWEYAASGPSDLLYPWGNDFVADNVVYEENATQTVAIGSRPQGASWVGALDMSGNVTEWVSSFFDPYPYIDTEESLGDSIRERVYRSGNWQSSEQGVISTYRRRENPTYLVAYVGVRCVRTE